MTAITVTHQQPAVKNFTVVSVSRDRGIHRYQADLVSLWARNLDRIFRDRFKWLYMTSLPAPVETWLALGGDGAEVFGCGSLCRRTVFVASRPLSAGIAFDFAVDRGHRSLGPALQIQRSLALSGGKSGLAFIFAFPNPASKGVFLRVGYSVLGEAEEWVKPLRTEYKLRRYRKLAAIARPLGWCIDLALRALDTVQKAGRGGRFIAELRETCNEQFDALWRDAQERYPIVGEKTASYLNWRYASCQAEQYRFYCALDAPGGRLRGYVVYALRDNIATIFDVFADDREAVLPFLLGRFCRQMRQEKVNAISVTYFGEPSFARLIRRLHFIRRPSRRSCLIYPGDSLSSAQQAFVRSRDNWFLFDGELDF